MTDPAPPVDIPVTVAIDTMTGWPIINGVPTPPATTPAPPPVVAAPPFVVPADAMPGWIPPGFNGAPLTASINTPAP